MKRFDTNNFFLRCLLSCIGVWFSVPVLAQSFTGVIKGTIIDGSGNRSLYGVQISNDSAAKGTSSFSNGQYLLIAGRGTHTLYVKLKGFQTKVITGIPVQHGQVVQLDLILYPDSSGQTIRVAYGLEKFSAAINRYYHSHHQFDILTGESIQPGSFKNGASLVQRMTGVAPVYYAGRLPSLTAFGMGERYNQVMLNNAVLNSFDVTRREYPFDWLPAEMIEKVSVQKTANPSVPADFAGGNISIRTKDFPDKKFLYLLAGTGFAQDTRGKDFFSDDRGKWEVLGFPGNKRSLPAGFPDSRSAIYLHEKNPQEQVFLSKKLANNLAPVNQGASPLNDRVAVGFGNTYTFKKGARLGIIGFISHQKNERIDESVVQAAPNVTENPYPFAAADKVLIRAQSLTTHYQYSSGITGLLNAAIAFGRNRVSLKNFFGQQFYNTYTQRSSVYKPDEDTLAHTGISYSAEQRKFISTQLSGEHALGKDSRFIIDWQAAYLFYRQQNPDERHFLLQQDPSAANRYAIATPSTTSLNTLDGQFTNSGRLWRTFTDHNFYGSFAIHVPFGLLNQVQRVSGGIAIQSRYRVFRSDLLLLNGPGFFTPDSLLAPEHYYPGGLTVHNFYIRYDSRANGGVIFPNNRGNYTGAANLGAAYIRFENKLTGRLQLDWGARIETNSQLVSNTEYGYFSGFKNPRLIPLDENSRVNTLDVLPSITVRYLAANNLQGEASWSRTVNRAQLQELSLYRYYDPLTFLVKTGNPLLGNSIIDNVEAGISWSGTYSTHISLTGSYKRIDQPIEYIVSAYGNAAANLLSTPHNTPPADIYSLNAAVTAGVGQYISAFANGNWTNATVKAGPLKSRTTANLPEHTLSGSPRYQLNGGITIQHPHYPMLTVLYNRIGDYISMLGSGPQVMLANGNSLSVFPDYRVKERGQLDIQLSQKLLRAKAQVIAGVTNLLGDSYIEYQDLNGNKKFDSPLSLIPNANNTGGLYQSGTDNTVINRKTQPVYYFSISYLFQ